MAEQTHIGRLTLTDFRNYRQLALEFGAGPVVFNGDNGAGKTNLLEAISFLTPGRGLRRAQLHEVTRIGAASGFAVHARVEGAGGEAAIGTGTMSEDARAADAGRRVRINGAPARSSEALLEWLRVIWLVPAMDGLFTGPAGDRRRFLDRLVLAIDPEHGRRALDYEKAMRGRNRLLAEERGDAGWFDAIEAQMAETGVAIAAARQEMVALLCRMIDALPADTPFPKSRLTLEGLLENRIGHEAAVDTESAFINLLRASRGRDRAAGRTLEGPHRSDLLVHHAVKEMPAAYCSTGEQKALLTGIVLAQSRLVTETAGMTPILLLDEIAAHLDPGRREALFSILIDMGCQAFLTGTDAALFSSLANRAQFFEVADGAVEAQ